MPGIYLRKYNVTLDLSTPGSFKIPQSLYKSASSSFAGSGDWTPSAGDVKVSIDGGAEANIGTLPSFSNGAWQYVLSSTELSAHTVHVRTSNAALSDDDFYVETFGNSSAMWPLNYENATNMGMTSLPSVAAGASGGLVEIGTGANQYTSDSSARVTIVPPTSGTMTLTTTATNLTNNTPTGGTITAATVVINNATNVIPANLVQIASQNSYIVVSSHINNPPSNQLPITVAGSTINSYTGWTLLMLTGNGAIDTAASPMYVTASAIGGTSFLTLSRLWNSSNIPVAGDIGMLIPPNRADLMSINASTSAASALSNASVDGNNHLIVQASGFTSGTTTLTSVVASGSVTVTGGTVTTVSGNILGGIGGTMNAYTIGQTGTANFTSLIIQAGTATLGPVHYSSLVVNDGTLTLSGGVNATVTAVTNLPTVALNSGQFGSLSLAASNTTQLPNLLQGVGPGTVQLTAHALALGPSGGGGGGGFGDGDIAVNQDTGGTDALRVLDNNNNPVDDAIIRAYVQTDYAAGLRNVAGSTMTGADGRWQHDLMLSAGNYTLTIDANGFQLDAVNITVS